MNKNIYYLIVFIVVLGVTVYLDQRSVIGKDFYIDMLNKAKAEHYYGRVLKKYVVEEGKYPDYKLMLSDNQNVKIRKVLWDEVITGDSVVKTEGDGHITIYKANGGKITYSHTRYIQDIAKEMQEQ